MNCYYLVPLRNVEDLRGELYVEQVYTEECGTYCRYAVFRSSMCVQLKLQQDCSILNFSRGA